MLSFLKPPADIEADAMIATLRAKNKWVIIPPVITAIGAFSLFFLSGPIIDFLTPILPDGAF